MRSSRRAFERWPGFTSFDVCQEPLPADDARPEPPPITKVDLTKRRPPRRGGLRPGPPAPTLAEHLGPRARRSMRNPTCTSPLLPGREVAAAHVRDDGATPTSPSPTSRASLPAPAIDAVSSRSRAARLEVGDHPAAGRRRRRPSRRATTATPAGAPAPTARSRGDRRPFVHDAGDDRRSSIRSTRRTTSASRVRRRRTPGPSPPSPRDGAAATRSPGSSTSRTRSAGVAPTGGRDSSRAASVSICSTIASSSSRSFEVKYRYTVPRATFASVATSRICTASNPPCSASRSAASSTRRRRAAWLRASAVSGAGLSLVAGVVTAESETRSDSGGNHSTRASRDCGHGDGPARPRGPALDAATPTSHQRHPVRPRRRRWPTSTVATRSWPPSPTSPPSRHRGRPACSSTRAVRSSPGGCTTSLREWRARSVAHRRLHARPHRPRLRRGAIRGRRP